MTDKPNEEPREAAPEKPSKMDAVKRSLETLGLQATIKEIQADVKTRFALDVSSTYAKRVKAEARAEGGARKPTEKPPATAPQSLPENPSSAEPSNQTGPVVLLQDILTLKSLVDRVGADNLRQLIAAFER